MRNPMRLSRRICAVLLLASLPLAWAQPVLAKTYTPEQEAHAGKEAADAILAKTPEWTNDQQKARCQAIVDTIAPQTERPDVKYTVRLLDTDEVNAFSVPGGYVFVTRGLLEPSADPKAAGLPVQSDDELAGVLAHEIAHNCHYDGLHSAERSANVLKGGLAAALLTLLVGGGAAGAFEVLNAGLTFGQGILNHYSIEYETAADAAAVDYLTKTSYNPSGLLTFIERLAAQDRAGLQQDLGVFQTHPYSSERVQAIKRAITSHGFEVNRRAVTNWSRAEALDAIVHGKPAAVVMLWDRTIYTYLDTAPTGETPAQRAQVSVERLNEALGKGMAQYDVQVAEENGVPEVTVMGERLLTVLPGDVEGSGTARTVAEAAAGELRAAMFGDVLGRTFKTGG
jgi:predicted Zn-dependent protease